MMFQAATPDRMDEIGRWVLVAGAVGVAAMGLVESLKWTPLGVMGLKVVERNLPAPALDALKGVYGADAFDAFLQGSWRKGEAELERTLSTGLRLAVFSTEDVALFARSFGEPDPAGLAEAVKLLREAKTEEEAGKLSEARARLARLETVIDARVKAAIASGSDRYTHGMQGVAALFSVGGCLTAAWLYHATNEQYGLAILIGVLAVPLAPISKDVVAFLSSLRDVFQRKQSIAP